MKRTGTKTIEYFEHEGDEYRRFPDGSWEWQLWGYSGDSDGWVQPGKNRVVQLEAIYQQPERCKTCKFYNENPYLHCAVHPGGPEGVCGDWEQRAVKERPAENDHYRHLVEQLNDASRDLHTVLSRPLRAPVGHDYFLDDLQSPPCDLSTVEIVGMSERVVTQLDFCDSELVETRETRTYTPITHQVLRANPLRDGTDEAELSFFRQCDHIVVGPEHISVVFCEDQPLIAGDIIYFNSSQSAIAIERNGQLIWRRRIEAYLDSQEEKDFQQRLNRLRS